MAFTLGSQKDIFSKLKNMAPPKRLDLFKSAQTEGGASPFSSLTPEQFAALFPDYYKKKLPEVEGFYKALSKKEAGVELGGEGKTYGPHGAAGSATVGNGEKVTNVVRAKEIYDYLRQKGIDHNHAVGIVNNMKYESQFNSGAIGDNGTSGGLFQHHASRFAAMKQYVGEDWKTNWRKQIDFALTEGEMKTYLGKNYANPTDASVGFTTHFEKPKDTDSTAQQRSGTAAGYATAMEGKGSEPSGTADVSKTSSKSGGFYGDNEQCASLSKHFSNLGAASGWKFNENAAITPGSIIATTNYGKGDHPGGVMAKDMPDGKSHYHTGVALSTPDEKGNVLILEQFAGQPARVAMVNVNNYRGSGERMAVVEGGEPSAKSMQAVEIGRSLANPDQLSLMGSVSTEPKVNAAKEAPATTQQAAAAAPAAVPVAEQAPAKKTTESYKFDPDKYWNEVKTKQPMADSMFYGKEKVMQETYQGFEEAQAAGAIKWNKKTNEIQILDPNHEKIQQIYQDMKSHNIDKNAFMTQTEAGGSGRATVHKHHKTGAVKFQETYDGFLPDLRPDLGAISGQWESGKHGAAANHGVETISTGKGDKGGISYGRHQLASKTGTMSEFLKSEEAAPFAAEFSKLKPGTAKFNAAYERVAKANPEAFDKAQHEFLARTHYTPFLKAAARLGYTVTDPRFQEQLFGTGVQFRNNTRHILEKAKHAVGKSVEEQIMAVAKAKQERAPSIKNRYTPEAEAILGKTPSGGFAKSNVMDITKYAEYTKEQERKKLAFEESKAPKVAMRKEMGPPVPTVAANAPTNQTATVAPTEKGYLQQAKDFVYDRIFAKPSLAKPVEPPAAKPVEQQQAAPPPPPAPPPGVYSAPDVDKGMLNPEPIYKDPKDKHSFNMEQLPPDRPQRQVNIDKFLERSNPQFSSPSLERAMKNISDTSGAAYGHFGTSNIG
jgi:hypothetical protein